MKFTSTHLFIVLIIVVIGGIAAARIVSEPKIVTGFYDEFASCLGERGAIFYGAFWCPHCQEQKKLFGNSSKLPYVECSTPDRQNQTPICIEEGITSYPTWKFSDGDVLDGVVELERLAGKTGCELPVAEETT